MAFAIIRTAKLKTKSEISASGSHNYRERKTPNANPKMTPKNQHIGARSKDELLAVFDERLKTQDKIRSNAVLGIEYLITASNEAFQSPAFNQKEYFNDALKFLQEKHGKENVVSGSIHLDETTPHLVVYVVPIDSKGKLNCRSFLGGPAVMSKLQTDFAKTVGERHGLMRGVENSSAEHVPIKEFYKKVNTPTPLISKKIPAIGDPTLIEKVLTAVGIPNDHSKLKEAVADAKKERQSEIRAMNEANYAKAQMYDLTKRNQNALKRDLSESKEKLRESQEKTREISNKLREIPLNTVLERFGAVQDPKDNDNWKTEQGRVTVTGSKFFNHDLSVGGGGSIDLTMHLHGCDYKTAIATLAQEFGQDATAAAVANESLKRVEEAVTAADPVQSELPADVPQNWPGVKKWLETTRKIPAAIVDAFRAQGLIRADERGNAVFVNQQRNGGEIRGKGANFKGYRGKRGSMIFTRGPEKSALVVESGSDAMAFCAQNSGFGKVISTGGSFGKETIEQLKDLQKQGFRIVVGTDNDKSGDAKFDQLRSALGITHAERMKPKGRDWQDDMKAAPVLESERARTTAPRI
jgi:hypothetical protein